MRTDPAQKSQPSARKPAEQRLHGIAVSPGIVIGTGEGGLVDAMLA